MRRASGSPRRGAPKAPAWVNPVAIADLLRLAIPIALARSSMMLMSITDVVVLSRNAPEELGYMLNAWLPVGVALGVSMGLLQGVQVMAAELSGSGRRSDTGRVFRRGLILSWTLGGAMMLAVLVIARPLFLGLGFEPEVAAGATSAAYILAFGFVGHMLTGACSLYLEALRRPEIATAILFAGVLFNLVADLALVAGWWGFEPMGADGAAWATTATRWLLAAALFAAVALLTPGLKQSAPAPKDEWLRQLQVGGGAAVSNAAEYGAFNFAFVIATWHSLAATGLFGVGLQAVGLSFMAFLGVGSASAVRVAEAFGRRDTRAVQDASRLAIAASICIGLALGALVFAARGPIAAFAMPTEPAAEQAALAALLAVAAAVILFDGLQAVASMAARAQEVAWPPALIHLGCYALVMLPAAYWLGVVMDRGAIGVMEGALIGSIAAGLAQWALLEWISRRPLNQRPL